MRTGAFTFQDGIRSGTERSAPARYTAREAGSRETMRDIDSGELLEQARAGSREALGRLFERSAGKLLALIRLRLGPRLRGQLESRDILQSCLLRASERLGQFHGSGSSSFMGWLARIAENEIRDQASYHARRKRDAARSVPLEEEAERLPAELRSALSTLALDERMQRLEQALETLEERHREIIVLRRLEELPYSEIALRLGSTPDACRMLYARAMAALTLRMQEQS
jgi:RNA polymerase sigma-70 factor (ECF subfamily)